jgi:hypothetical protein
MTHSPSNQVVQEGTFWWQVAGAGSRLGPMGPATRGAADASGAVRPRCGVWHVPGPGYECEGKGHDSMEKAR